MTVPAYRLGAHTSDAFLAGWLTDVRTRWSQHGRNGEEF